MDIEDVEDGASGGAVGWRSGPDGRQSAPLDVGEGEGGGGGGTPDEEDAVPPPPKRALVLWGWIRCLKFLGVLAPKGGQLTAGGGRRLPARRADGRWGLLSAKHAARIFSNCQSEEQEEEDDGVGGDDGAGPAAGTQAEADDGPARDADDEMVFPEFVEALCATANFVVREPQLPAETRLELCFQHVLPAVRG